MMITPEQAAYDPTNDPLALPRNDAAVQEILSTATNENEQLDAICKARGIPVYHNDLLDAYLTGTLSLTETVYQCAAPIEEHYTSADSSWMFWEMESTARSMRPLCSPAEALHYWGEPVTTCQPNPALEFATNRIEAQLDRLWSSIIHAPRKTDSQDRTLALLNLVQALKARPNPPLPQGATPALRNSFVWKSGALWSELTCLGPNAWSAFNDHPGGTMGFTRPETQAWENYNDFLARLTATGTADFMVYGICAMRLALEGGIAGDRQARMTLDMKASRMEVTLRVIVVWLQIAGVEMYDRVRGGADAREDAEYVEKTGLDDSEKLSAGVEGACWVFWKSALNALARNEEQRSLSRSYAMRALARMQEVEGMR